MIADYKYRRGWAERTRHSNYYSCEGTEERLSDCDSVNDTSLTSTYEVARLNCTNGR